MSIKLIDGAVYKNLVINGAANLRANYKYVDALNVFPVPDGDTGTNMRMTIEAGSEAIKKENTNLVNEMSKLTSRSMLMGARGNSGVILSQFFRGLCKGLESYESCNVVEFAHAMQAGVDQAYHAVLKPVEGTILTVARESVQGALEKINSETTLEEYFDILIACAEVSLQGTPELLPVLKEAGVVDSGGAGFIEVMKGMQKWLKGEEIIVSDDAPQANSATIDRSTFNYHSTLEYGYCTEFILQLTYSKVPDIKAFDIKVISDWLQTVGNSIVALQDEDIVKVHVHTMDPGLVLSHCREYGEYLTLKIENMQVSHTEAGITPPNDPAQCNCPECVAARSKERKKYAVVAVASGTGLVKTFQDMGVDYIVSGGQSMNPSADDFTKGFDLINAENIIVLPNNSNIVLTAEQAAKYYEGDAKVTVVPCKTLAQGYSALTMLDLTVDTVEEVIEGIMETISNVTTGLITYSIRDTEFEDVKIKKDDFISIVNGKIVASNASRFDAIKDLLAKSDASEKEIITIIYGAGITKEEVKEVEDFISDNYDLEIDVIEGNQEVYSYIFSIE